MNYLLAVTATICFSLGFYGTSKFLERTHNRIVAKKGADDVRKYINYTQHDPDKLPAIVRLTKDGRTYCSGTVIDEHTILTASHCVVSQSLFGMELNNKPIEIMAYDNVHRGTFGKVKADAVSIQLDRALIKGNFSIFQPAPYISDVTTSVSYRLPGTRIISCGYPLGGDFYCSDSVYIGADGFAMKTTAVLIPGMSGGPAFLEDGRLVAVNIAVNDKGEAIITPAYNIDMMK